MANGTLVFAEPWEGRLFGMAHALTDAGVFTWDDFRAALIAEIQSWEARATAQPDYRYYVCFAAALESLLRTRGALEAEALADRCATLAARAPGHDHSHDHDHDLDHDHQRSNA